MTYQQKTCVYFVRVRVDNKMQYFRDDKHRIVDTLGDSHHSQRVTPL